MTKLVSQSPSHGHSADPAQPNVNSQLSAVDELLPVDPNPFPMVPFQCSTALGVPDEHLRQINDSLLAAEDSENQTTPEKTPTILQQTSTQSKSFLRSNSVSVDKLREKSGSTRLSHKRLSESNFIRGGGDSAGESDSSDSDGDSATVMTRPSPALQNLFIFPSEANDENVEVEEEEDKESLHDFQEVLITDVLQRPVMTFVLQWNDLDSLRTAMTSALRKSACRTYGMQALNWLLRSVSQPACLHDLLWCFAAALEGGEQTEKHER